METSMHTKLKQLSHDLKTKAQFIGCHQLKLMRKHHAKLTKKVQAYDAMIRQQQKETHQLTIKI